MPHFICEKCCAKESTSLANFWVSKAQKSPLLCSECLTGTWHGVFEKCVPTVEQVVDQHIQYYANHPEALSVTTKLSDVILEHHKEHFEKSDLLGLADVLLMRLYVSALSEKETSDVET